jgi:ZIP family zinc transporter
MIIIAPMLMAGYSPAKTLLIAVLTGLVEVIGTILGYHAVTTVTSLLPFALSFAGGTMLYVICTEMMPDARNAPYWVLSGFSIMMIFSMLL